MTDGRLYTIAHQLRYNAFGTAALTPGSKPFFKVLHSASPSRLPCWRKRPHALDARACTPYITKLVTCIYTFLEPRGGLLVNRYRITPAGLEAVV